MSEHSHTVGSLRKRLEDFPDHLPVYVSSDSEGNSYSPLWDVAKTKFSGHDYNEIHPVHEDDLDEYDPEDLVEAVGLWP